jgi:putative hydrolase of the HAD superfamily
LGHRGVRRYVWSQALKAARLPDDEDWVGEVAEFYIEERTRACQWLPGAKETLTQLKERYRLGLITNGATEIQRQKVERLDLASFCATIHIAEESGCSKPDPRIFRRAMGALEASPAESLMVGDRPETDIIGARNCGMRTAWIPMDERGPWPYPHFEPDWTIASVVELPDLLAQADAA